MYDEGSQYRQIEKAIHLLGRKIGPKHYKPGTEGDFPKVSRYSDDLWVLDLTECPTPKASVYSLPIGDGLEPDVKVEICRPCESRTCPECQVPWRRKIAARIFSGGQYPSGATVHPRRFHLWTITPPGTADDIEEWNRTVAPRFRQVWVAMKRRFPVLEAYSHVKEFQERGLLHLHVLVRQQHKANLPKKDLVPEGWVSKLLERRGFGSHRWRHITEIGVTVGYMTKHLLDTIDNERFPRHARAVAFSINWGLSWKQHRSGGRGRDFWRGKKVRNIE